MASALAAFHFLRPALLWALLPFALYALTLYFRASAASPWQRAVEPHLLERLMTGRRLRAWLTPDVALVPLAALAVFAVAGPTWAPQAETGDPAHSPLAIVMELSHSMGGTDVSPSRAERARLELRDLMHARPASPTSLVVVAGSAHVLMPMTDDPSVLEPYLTALAPDLMPSDGEAFAPAAKLIEPIAEAAKAPLSVLLVSDGIPPDGAAAFEELHRKRGVGFVSLGRRRLEGRCRACRASARSHRARALRGPCRRRADRALVRRTRREAHLARDRAQSLAVAFAKRR